MPIAYELVPIRTRNWAFVTSVQHFQLGYAVLKCLALLKHPCHISRSFMDSYYFDVSVHKFMANNEDTLVLCSLQYASIVSVNFPHSLYEIEAMVCLFLTNLKIADHIHKGSCLYPSHAPAQPDTNTFKICSDGGFEHSTLFFASLLSHPFTL